jgi:O-antigen ligase
MTISAVASPIAGRGKSDPIAREHGVKIVQAFAIALFVVPSKYVVRAIGAIGYPAGLVGMFALAVWVVAVILAHHDPRLTRHPIRGVLAMFWIVSLASYILSDRGLLNSTQLLGADRWLMQLAEMTGIALLAAECLNSRDDVRRVARVVSWASAFCGVVALLQWRAGFNLAPYLGRLPGLTDDGVQSLMTRGGLSRVSGTGIHPIELGVTAAMLLPIALWAAMQTDVRSNARRWAPVVLTAIAIPATVARSAVIAVVCALGMFIVLMPARQRLVAFALLPVAIGAVFVSSHGEIGTLAELFTAGNSDSSVAHRTNDYSYVSNLVSQAPWLGTGGGTYFPDSNQHILDNEYLMSAIELGLTGVVAVACFFLFPLFIALSARRRSQDPPLRLLCAGLAGAALAGGVCSAFFDSFSFPLFYNTYAIVLGLIGACWRLAKRESTDAQIREFRPDLAARRIRECATFRTRRLVDRQGRLTDAWI